MGGGTRHGASKVTTHPSKAPPGPPSQVISMCDGPPLRMVPLVLRGYMGSGIWTKPGPGPVTAKDRMGRRPGGAEDPWNSKASDP